MYVCMFIHVFMFCVSLREHNQKYVPPLIHAWHPCDTWMSHVTQSLSHKNGSCHTSMVPHECVMAHSWNVTHEWVMSRSHCRTRISHVTHPWSLMNVSWNTVGTSNMNESCHAVNVALKWVMSHINGPIWMSHDTQPGRQKMNESWYLSIFRGRSFTPILAVAGSWMYVCERAAICVYVSLLNVCVCVCMCHLWVCVCVCVSPMIVCVCIRVTYACVCVCVYMSSMSVCVYLCHLWVENIHASDWYGVATISRLLKIIGLFCKRALWKRRYSADENYNLKEPTNRSHPIYCDSLRVIGVPLYEYIGVPLYIYIYRCDSLYLYI